MRGVRIHNSQTKSTTITDIYTLTGICICTHTWCSNLKCSLWGYVLNACSHNGGPTLVGCGTFEVWELVSKRKLLKVGFHGYSKSLVWLHCFYLPVHHNVLCLAFPAPRTVVFLHAFLFLKTEILRNQEHKQSCPPLQRHSHTRVTTAAMEGEGELPWLPRLHCSPAALNSVITNISLAVSLTPYFLSFGLRRTYDA